MQTCLTPEWEYGQIFISYFLAALNNGVLVICYMSVFGEAFVQPIIFENDGNQ